MHLYNMIKKHFIVISEGNMSVKEIRKRTGLTQKKFSELSPGDTSIMGIFSNQHTTQGLSTLRFGTVGSQSQS